MSRQNFKLSRQLFVDFQEFFSIMLRQKFECRDISSTICLLFCHDNCSDVATIVLPSLIFSDFFLALFASFDFDSYKTIILVKIP